MKKKKLLTIGASSLMLLNTGLLPAAALAEEKTTGTEEVAPELADSLKKENLPEATPESNDEPVQEVTETTEEKSVPTAESNTAADTEGEESGGSLIKPMDIGLIAWGKIGLKTSTGKELVINNQKTEGILSVDLNITQLANLGIADKTYYQVKLPNEFKPLLEDPRFINYLSGEMKAYNLGIPIKSYTYKSTDIKVDPETCSLIIQNPKITTIIGLLPHVYCTVNIDLGGFVTDTEIRIPNSLDGKYHFNTGLTQDNNVIDWTVGGGKESSGFLEYAKLDPAYGTEKPVLTAENRKIVLGDDFTGAFAMKGVSAIDKEDGDITKNVIIIDNQVRSNVPGVYPVTYKITDSHGLTATKTIEVTVAENTLPVINAENKVIEKGMPFNPLEGVTAHDEEDGDLTSKIVIKSNTVNTNAVGKYYITYSVEDTHKGITTKDIEVTVKESVHGISPDDYTVGQGLITGKYEGDVSYLEFYVDGHLVSEGGTFKDGKFSYEVSTGLIKKNSKVVLVAYDKDKKKLDEKTVKVLSNYSGTISAYDYTVGDEYIRGTYTGDVKKAKVIINGKVLSIGGTFRDGEFSYWVGKNAIKKGDSVLVNGYDVDGDVLTQNNRVNILAAPAAKGTITPNKFTVGSVEITGTYTDDVKKAKLYVNDKLISQGGTFKNGSFTYYVGQNVISKGASVRLVAYSAEDIELDNKTVQVESTTAGSILADSYTVGDEYITGTYTGDVKKAKVIVNGAVLSLGGTFNNGRFTYWVGTSKIKAGDSVLINGYDQNNVVLTQNNPVNVKQTPAQKGTITPSQYTVGNGEITGTYTGDVKKARLSVNGNVISWGGTFKNGQFTYYVGNSIKQGDVVTMNAYGENDVLLQENVKVNFASSSYNGSISPNTYTVGAVEITGIYVGDVKQARLYVNNGLVSIGGSFKNGTFNYYVGDAIKKGDSVYLVAYGPDGKELDRKTVQVN
ncbi:immunoglobulin-like domain-containing protein [Enterococcus sp. DIV0756]|uniref:immunoglobulin-like domain-containing protein n=1 Tax=Enterococcus sp. DIV0756 TaxID=2774636 RepID=UPI003F204856